MSSNSNLFIPLSNFANTKYLYKYDCFQLLSGGGNCREKPFPNRATMSLNVTYGLIVFFLFATLLYIQYFTCFFFSYELSVLCDVEIGLIVFSGNGGFYEFSSGNRSEWLRGILRAKAPGFGFVYAILVTARRWRSWWINQEYEEVRVLFWGFDSVHCFFVLFS